MLRVVPEKLSDKVDEYSSALSEVTRELCQLQARYVPASDLPTATLQCHQQCYQQQRQTDKPGKLVGSSTTTVGEFQHHDNTTVSCSPYSRYEGV